MLSDIKGVIFDLDGTLVDSMWMWKDIDIEYLGQFGIECPDDIQNEIEGMSFDETASYFKNRFSLSHSIQEIQQNWNEMAWDKYSNEVPLKDGALEFLQYLNTHNIPCGIASSNSIELIELIVSQHKIADYFKTVRNSNEVAKGKPSPDIYLLAAKDMGVNPEECLVFEDVLQGVIGGKNAKMKVCNVFDKYSRKDKEAIFSIADYHIRNYHEITAGTFDNLTLRNVI